ncbi:protoglobin domain-containing protein [Leptothrix ochracea]|uniref:protoglobin domain-containing protein n=1 Tax=Leptothrix ochracea TaxID=735331 RepID=UPI0034E1CCE0
MDIFEITQKIIGDIPEGQRFSSADAELLMRFKSQLLAMEDELVQGFYDTIQANPQMACLIGHGARAERETTLRRWWQRTLNGPFDDKYWAWQSLVGVVHIKVGVKNPMMMGMWTWVLDWMRSKVTPEFVGSASLACDIMSSVERLSLTSQAITAESYLVYYLETVIRITGFKPALLERMFKSEIDVLLGEVRGQLGQI